MTSDSVVLITVVSIRAPLITPLFGTPYRQEQDQLYQAGGNSVNRISNGTRRSPDDIGPQVTPALPIIYGIEFGMSEVCCGSNTYGSRAGEVHVG